MRTMARGIPTTAVRGPLHPGIQDGHALPSLENQDRVQIQLVDPWDIRAELGEPHHRLGQSLDIPRTLPARSFEKAVALDGPDHLEDVLPGQRSEPELDVPQRLDEYPAQAEHHRWGPPL